jgi:two-component system, OmpR family, copper resistance phosphate regulon response regulator CusR
MHVLIIEDERKLAQAIATGLEETGYSAKIVHTGEDGLRLLHDEQFDLILLDVMLPRASGLEALREMRRDGFKNPVLILTSRASVDDRVRGLDSGADDYLVKPFAFPELLARLRALQRRANPNSPSVLQLADLRMDTRGRSVTRGTTSIDLTGREFELLEYLLVHRSTVISREMLARDVWKTTVRHTSLDNVIDVHIARIRRKIDDPFPLKLLQTVRGVGFILRGSEEEA